MDSDWLYDWGPNAMSQQRRHSREAKGTNQTQSTWWWSSQEENHCPKISWIFLEIIICTRPTRATICSSIMDHAALLINRMYVHYVLLSNIFYVGVYLYSSIKSPHHCFWNVFNVAKANDNGLRCTKSTTSSTFGQQHLCLGALTHQSLHGLLYGRKVTERKDTASAQMSIKKGWRWSKRRLICEREHINPLRQRSIMQSRWLWKRIYRKLSPASKRSFPITMFPRSDATNQTELLFTIT